MTSPRPTDDDLAALRLSLTLRQIADVYGVGPRTVDQWVAEMKLRRGATTGRRVEARAKARTQAEIAALADEMLQRAIDTVRDDGQFVTPREKIAQAKLAIEVHNVLIERVAAAPKDKPTLGRPELLERVKEATKSASRRLRVVGSDG